jgi:hypothetical protein
MVLLGLVFSWPAMLWQDVAGTVDFCVANQWLALLSTAGDILRTLAGAALMIVNSINKIWLLLALTVAFLMYLSCVGIGTVCFQLAVHKR